MSEDLGQNLAAESSSEIEIDTSFEEDDSETGPDGRGSSKSQGPTLGGMSFEETRRLG